MLNMIKVHIVCNILAKGTRGIGKIFSGKIIKAEDVSDAVLNIKGDGTEILLTRFIDPSFKPILKKVKGIILEEYSAVHLDEVRAINPDLVIVSGVRNAMASFEDNLIITIDGEEKLIYEGVIDRK
jgi:phosphohistidine swiveling domain-containing protein